MTKCRRSPRPLGQFLRRTLAPREGQGLIEFALAVPIFLLLIFAVIGFGILLENRIALNDAARNGARFAAAQPDAWDNTTPTAAPNTIESAIQHSGSTINIPNDNSHMQISYLTVGTGAPTLCGSYDATATSDANKSSLSSCLMPGNLIKVTVTGTFQLPVPLISAFFPNGVTITTSATAMEEQSS